MRRPLISSFLAFLFLFVQCVSIAQTSELMTAMSSQQDFLEDIDIEDVVPMDPFIAPQKTQNLPIVSVLSFAIQIAIFRSWLTQFTLSPDIEEVITALAPVEQVNPHPLWLLHRALLI